MTPILIPYTHTIPYSTYNLVDAGDNAAEPVSKVEQHEAINGNEVCVRIQAVCRVGFLRVGFSIAKLST